MSPSAVGVALVGVSALTHTLWNLKTKGSQPTAAFMLAANSLGALLLLPLLIFTGSLASPLPRASWGYLFLSAFFETLYYLGLGRAYRAGDLSAAYPVAKGLPVFLVALLSFFWFDKPHRAIPYFGGMAIIVLGILFIALRKKRATSTGPAPVFWWWVALAGTATAGYTLSDAAALSQLPREAGVPPILQTLTYLFWMALVTSAFLTALVWLGAKKSWEPIGPWKWRTAFVVGAGMQLSYGLVLVSMAYLPNPAVVMALRQLSLPMTSLASAWFLKEKTGGARWAGMALIGVGVVWVKWG